MLPFLCVVVVAAAVVVVFRIRDFMSNKKPYSLSQNYKA